MSVATRKIAPRSTLLESDHDRSRPLANTTSALALLARTLNIWHLLSLDAPTVAALWAVFIANAAHVSLPWTTTAAMFLAVWVLYAADRLLDSRNLVSYPQSIGLEARHHFHFQHRRGFVAAILVCFPALLLLLSRANATAIRLDLALGSLLLVWLLIVHRRPAAHRLPKELAVGLIFPAAVFIPTVARVPQLRSALLPDALLLATVCSLNCLYIYAWEHPNDRDYAHTTTRWATGRLPQLTRAALISTLLVACAQLVFLSSPQRPLALLAVACAISILCLLFLQRRHTRFAPVTLRAAADLALLTPAPLLVLRHLLPR